MGSLQQAIHTADAPESTQKGKPNGELPPVFWATVIIGTVNAVLATWFFLSPNLTMRTDLERLHPLDEQGLTAKTSPFETYQPEPPRKTRAVAATRMRPVVQQLEPVYDAYMPVATAAAVTSRPQTSGYVSGARVYEVLEAQMQKVSRASATLTEPVRRLSEQAIRHIETKIVPSVSDPVRSLRPLR